MSPNGSASVRRPASSATPALVYGRVTGWGRGGSLRGPARDTTSTTSRSPVRWTISAGRVSRPCRRSTFSGTTGAGGCSSSVGIMGALVERASSGRGQVVDAAMVDGVSLLMTLFYGLRAEGLWSDEPGSNILDLGAPQYNVYETADGRYVSVGAGEPKFYRELLQAPRARRNRWSASRDSPRRGRPERSSSPRPSRQRTLAQWCALLEGTETCFAPVLTLAEAPGHPHHVARGAFVEVDGVVQPAAAPRFDRTPTASPGRPVVAGQDTIDALVDWGVERGDVRSLVEAGVVRQAPSRLSTDSRSGPPGPCPTTTAAAGRPRRIRSLRGFGGCARPVRRFLAVHPVEAPARGGAESTVARRRLDLPSGRRRRDPVAGSADRPRRRIGESRPVDVALPARPGRPLRRARPSNAVPREGGRPIRGCALRVVRSPGCMRSGGSCAGSSSTSTTSPQRGPCIGVGNGEREPPPVASLVEPVRRAVSTLVAVDDGSADDGIPGEECARLQQQSCAEQTARHSLPATAAEPRVEAGENTAGRDPTTGDVHRAPDEEGGRLPASRPDRPPLPPGPASAGRWSGRRALGPCSPKPLAKL